MNRSAESRPAACRARGCDATVPVCPGCGERWTHVTQYSDGAVRYSSVKLVAKYNALYGEAPGLFVEVRA